MLFVGVVIYDKFISPSKPSETIKYVKETEIVEKVHKVFVTKEVENKNISTKTITEKIDNKGKVTDRITQLVTDLSTTNKDLNLGINKEATTFSNEKLLVSDNYKRKWLLGIGLNDVIMLKNVSSVSLDNINLQVGYNPIGNIWVLSSFNLSSTPVVSLSLALTL